MYKLNTLSKSLRCVLFDVPPLFLTFLKASSQLEIVLPLLPGWTQNRANPIV